MLHFPKENKISIAKDAIKFSLPILFAYGSFGVIYGLLFEQEGFSWYYAPMFSLFIYAGAVQFPTLGLMAVKAPILTLAVTALPISLRNTFYGISFTNRYNVGPFLKSYLAHSLVDANYSILLNYKKDNARDDIYFCFVLSFLGHFYWVVGTIIGSLVGKRIPNTFQGLNFALTALFASLSYDQFKKNNRPFLSCLVLLLCAFFVLSTAPEQLILGTLLLYLLVINLIEWAITNAT